MDDQCHTQAHYQRQTRDCSRHERFLTKLSALLQLLDLILDQIFIGKLEIDKFVEGIELGLDTNDVVNGYIYVTQ